MEYNDYELCYMIRENEDALSYILRKYEPLYKKVSYFFIKKYPNSGFDFEDLLQQCRFITCYAIDKFDLNNNVLFYSFLLICLKKGLSNYTKRHKKEVSYYMDYDNYENFEEFVDDKDLNDYILDRDFDRIICDFKFSLPFLESCVFELRCNGFSYKEIGDLLDIKVKKVDNCLQLIRKKLEKHLLF